MSSNISIVQNSVGYISASPISSPGVVNVAQGAVQGIQGPKGDPGQWTAIVSGDYSYVISEDRGTVKAFSLISDVNGWLDIQVRKYPFVSGLSNYALMGQESLVNSRFLQDTGLSSWNDISVESGDVLQFYVSNTPSGGIIYLSCSVKIEATYP